MKKSLSLLFAVLCLGACMENELQPEYYSDSGTIYASMESIDATRTSMDEYNNVLWSEEDQLVAFMKTTLGIKYQIKEQYVGTTTGGFSKVQEAGSGDDLESGQEIDHNVVLYPHSDQVWCMKYDNSTPAKAYKLNVVLPETQAYAENSFANGAFPMVAVSTNNQLTFKNICGGVKLQFKGVDKIKSIKLEGLGNEAISGKSSVVAYADGSTPTITMAATTSKSVTLDCGEGVQLSESTPTTFIIAVPPVTFSSGMKITITDTDGLSKTLTNSSSNTIKRSSLLNFPVITYKQNGVLEFPEGALTSYELPAEGGTIEIPVVTNLDYEVVIPDDASDWISVVETKALREETITLSVAANPIATIRSAEISITDNEGAVLQTITINQEAAVCDIDDSQFNPDLYLRYVSNNYYEGNGGAFDYNMYYYSSYIYNNAFAKASKVEYKFQLATIPESACYLNACRKGDSVYKIYFNQYGLYIQYTSYSWEALGVNPTDIIVLSFEGDTMCVNGKIFTIGEIKRSGYIFSGYYSDSDDGVYSEYYSFQDNAKLFYAKGWDADEKLIYLGGPAVSIGPSGSDEACWKSVYHYNNKISTQYDFAYYTDQQEYTPYGFGNLLGPEEEVTDLSASGTANCYIVSEAGSYIFTPTKGNGSESVGSISSVEVLWETFGTYVTPNVGDLVKNVKYSDGLINFDVPEAFKEGNAVIAAKDASGNILWSWHIWLTDEPQGQVYYNNAGTMMDRNLGATSATPGDVGALGLLYQWGRKDPFLGSSSIHNDSMAEAKSTITWPSVVESNSTNGTIEYAIANPTTFIYDGTSKNHDWYYTGNSSTDNTRWTESDKAKSIYDPCPAGWRVPDGGSNCVWSSALGSSSHFYCTYDSTNEGMNFSGKFGSDQTIWYPASGYRDSFNSSLYYVGLIGIYWSASPNNNYAYYLRFSSNGYVSPSYSSFRAYGFSVRCLQE